VKSIKPDAATLSITADRSVFWKDERMSDEQLAQLLHASAPRQPQPEDFMRGDRQAGLPARRPGDGGCAEVRGCWNRASRPIRAAIGVSRKTLNCIGTLALTPTCRRRLHRSRTPATPVCGARHID